MSCFFFLNTCSSAVNSSIVTLIAKQFIEHTLSSGIWKTYSCIFYVADRVNFRFTLRRRMTNSSLLLVDSLSDDGKCTLNIHFIRNTDSYTFLHLSMEQQCSALCKANIRIWEKNLSGMAFSARLVGYF